MDDHNFFVSYSEGFKGGGFDPRGQTSAATDLNNDGTVSPEEIFAYMNFLPETVKSYEAGWNANSNGRQVDVPHRGFLWRLRGRTGSRIDWCRHRWRWDKRYVCRRRRRMRAKPSLPGIEFEGLFRANDNLSLNWAIGYLDADYKEYVVNGVDVPTVAVFQNTPEWTSNAGLTLKSPVSLFGRDGNLYVIPSQSYRSETTQFEFPNPLLDQTSFTLLGSQRRLGRRRRQMACRFARQEPWRRRVQGCRIRLWPTGGNLGLEGNDTAFYGNPLTVTATAEYRF